MSSKHSAQGLKSAELLAFAVCALALVARVLANATVIDDSFITFRVIDNLFNGYGLRWNLDERVQVYTHPLWMLAHIPAYGLIGNFYIANILLSAAFSVAAVVLLVRSMEASPWHKAVLLLVPLLLSKTFVSFTMCGLETPMSFCMFAWFIHEWLRPRYSRERLCLIAGLCILVRFDNVIPLLPALACIAWTHRREWRLGRVALCFSPLLLWCAFSLLYYGFVLPNTKYAKTNTGIPLSDHALQGLRYLYNFSYYDTLSFAVMLSAGGWALWHASKLRALPDSKPLLLGLGVVLDVLYVIAVGGDYMCGRFFAVAFFIAVATGFAVLHAAPRRQLTSLLAAGVAAILLNLVLAEDMPDVKDFRVNFGINDHTNIYYPRQGLFSDRHQLLRTQITYNLDGLATYNPDAPQKVGVQCFIGYLGFYAPRDITLIDCHALSEPLLARLPVYDVRRWRIGHFPRAIPKGYIYARETGDTSQMEPSLARYYEKLRIVTSGELFSMERLETIIGFQLGAYEHWRQEYLDTIRRPPG